MPCPTPYRPLIHVLAYGGLRWGEAVALRRHRCDLGVGRLIVAESLADVNGRAIFGDTKTHRVRKTRIPQFLVEELITHLETVDLAPDSLLFTAPRGGPLRIANFRRRVWWPALEVAQTSSLDEDPRPATHVREPADPPGCAPEGDPASPRSRDDGHHDGPLRAPAPRPVRRPRVPTRLGAR